MEPKDILEKIHPGETDNLEKFASPEGYDFIADDEDFWRASDGWQGLMRRRSNAACLVQLCQTFNPETRTERDELRLMTAQAIMISFYCGCSLLEFGPRLLVKDFPHSCARTATQIYWDMERRATLLCSMCRPELLDQLHQTL